MQILINSDSFSDGRGDVADYLETVVREALAHYASRITRVEAHLSDADSAAKAHGDEIHCTLQATVAGLHPLIVKDHAATTNQAIHRTVGRLERAVISALGKQDSRRKAGLSRDVENQEAYR